MFAASITHIASTNEQIETLEMQLKKLRIRRDDEMFTLWSDDQVRTLDDQEASSATTRRSISWWAARA